MYMEYKQLTKNVKIPVLGLGTWGVGGSYFPVPFKDKQHVEALREGIKLGMTHIDTAEMYATGHAEEVVAKAVKPFDRKKIFITTKVSGNHLRYDEVLEACERSLKRLKTEWIDLYLIHWPSSSVPLKETMSAMEELANSGMIRFIGVSNFSVEEMIEAQSHLKKHKIVTNQVHYSLLRRESEEELLPYCQKKGILLTAYTPLEQGRLARSGFKALDETAKKYDKTQAQVAINWLISKKNVITIPKSTNIDHLKENLGAIGWKLKKEDTERLNNAF